MSFCLKRIWGESMLFYDILEEWIHFHQFEVSGSSITLYKRNIDLLQKSLGCMEVNEITQNDIQNLFIEFHKNGLKENTILNYSKPISMSLRYAVEKGYIDTNPYYGIKIPKGEKKEINPFTVEEFRKILSIEMKVWLRDAIEIAYRTGLRKGEIFALRKEDIELDERFIVVRHTQSLVGNEYVIKGPKTKYSKRRVDFDTACYEILKRRCSQNESDFLFYKKDGTMFIPNCISNTIARKCKKAGIKKHTFHDFRHGHATYLLQRNVHPKIVQERLGHASISTTLDTYSHLIPGLQKTAVAAVEKI